MALKGKVLIQLPATVQADGGLKVSKENGVFTFEPDWSVLEELTSLPEPESKDLWVLDPTTNVYYRLSVQALIDNLPIGPAGTITPGTVTTLAAGSSATVVNVGTDTEAILEFGIPRGADAGVKWLFDASTSMADPGAGEIRFNNASLASVTAIAVSATGSGADISDWVATWDDSTNPTVKAYLIFREEAANTVAIFSLSAVTDNTDWLQLAVSYVAGSMSLAASDPIYVVPLRIGNKGADGAGTGDMVTTNNLSDVSNKRAAQDNISVHGSDVASAATVNLETATGDLVDVTGTTTITAITLNEGHERTVRFTGALTLTHGASLVLPGGASITTAAGDFAVFRGYASSVVRCVEYTKASGKAVTLPTLTELAARGQGKETIGVASGGIFQATTNGCSALAQGETTTNKVNYKYLAFDASAVEYAWIWFPTPKSYNASTFTMRFIWTHPSTTTNFGVVWQVEMLSLADDDAMDTAVGTAVTVTDTGGTTGDFYTSAETGAITPSNTASKQDWIGARISRLATNGSDTLAVDAHLVGVEIYFNTNAATDA